MKNFLFATYLLVFSNVVSAQGITTSSINGKVIDNEGAPLPGTTILAIHQPTGAEFGSISDEEGLFRIANMHVGGPYIITISFIGYEPTINKDIYLELGRTFRLKTTLSESVTELEGVVVTANEVFDGNRTGAGTVISKDVINVVPTVTRNLSDFTRMTPQASNTTGGISIAGINNRYNAIYIDGAVNNDVFGLASTGTNGGQIGISPISIDAIEQLQVVVAPYDITQGGFAGGGINAVTRSGTNKFEGSVYYFFRNEKFAGLAPVDDEELERTRLDEFTAKTYGVRVGGPIIKNKIFFFLNAEVQDDQTPKPFDIKSYNGKSEKTDLDTLSKFLKSQYDYDDGGYANQIATLKGIKLLGRLDFNINKNHKLTARHSYTKGESSEPGNSNSSTINYGGTGKYFPSITNSSAFELKSSFGSSLSNNLIIGYTHVKDDRDPIGNDFPFVRINDGSGSIYFGSEQYSTANLVEQKIFTITDNLNIYKNKHTFTVGTHLEFFDMNNIFIPKNFGSYNFEDLTSFLNNKDSSYTRFDRNFSLVDNATGDATKAAAKFKAMQLAFYAQDEIQTTDNFKLVIGLRLDIPVFTTTPLENQYFNNTTTPLLSAAGYDLKGATVGKAPKVSFMFSPRVGFNWNINGEDDMQLRGGIGIFTSRIPLVWLGGMYNNTGKTSGGISSNSGMFNPDPYSQPDGGATIPLPETDPGSGNIDLFSENFKFPQLLRSSLAVDKKLPWGLVGTIEAIWSKTLNNVLYENLNIKPSTTALTGTGDTRNTYTSGIVDEYLGIYLGSNTNKGYSISITGQLTKSFDNGFAGSVAYTYGNSEAVFDGTSSQNGSQWRNNYTVQGRNFSTVGRSWFSMGSRVVANLSYTKSYAKSMATTISLFYNGQSGNPFSYTYGRSTKTQLTGEDSRERALLYVPMSSSDIHLVEYKNGSDVIISPNKQWEALNAYITNDDYLNSRRGNYVDKNSSRTPFSNIIDLKLAQDFYINTGGVKHAIQVTFDVFNFGNLLNKNWGRKYNSIDDWGTALLDFTGFKADGTTPEFTYNVEKTKLSDYIDVDDSGVTGSRWHMQMGIRYFF